MRSPRSVSARRNELKQLISGGVDAVVHQPRRLDLLRQLRRDDDVGRRRRGPICATPSSSSDKEGKGTGAEELGEGRAALGEDLDPDAVEDLAAERPPAAA